MEDWRDSLIRCDVIYHKHQTKEENQGELESRSEKGVVVGLSLEQGIRDIPDWLADCIFSRHQVRGQLIFRTFSTYSLS